MKKRRLPKRKIRKIIIFTVLIILLLSVAAVMSFTVLFKAKNVTAEGSLIYSPEQIVNASGINTDRSILAVREDTILENIRENLPYIGNISIKRKFPDSIMITATDAIEQFCYKIGEYYYTVGADNYIISKSNASPNITAVICDAVLDGEKQNKIKIANAETERALSNIISAFSEKNFTVNTVDVMDLNDIKIRIDDRFTVNIGSEIYLKEKIGMLEKMIETLDESQKGTFKLGDWTPENHSSYFVENNEN